MHEIILDIYVFLIISIFFGISIGLMSFFSILMKSKK